MNYACKYQKRCFYEVTLQYFVMLSYFILYKQLNKWLAHDTSANISIQKLIWKNEATPRQIIKPPNLSVKVEGTNGINLF